MRRHQTGPPDLATLVAAVPTPDFGDLLLAYISQHGRIRNLGGFYWQSVKRSEVLLSLWIGELSDYRLRRSSDAIIGSPEVFREMHRAVLACKENERHVELLRPQNNDPRRIIIDKIGIRERLSVVTRDKDSALFTFFLRSREDGPVTDIQLEGYREVLPVAHELMALRHKLVGSEAFQFVPGTSVASLKERAVPPFETLSGREVQICDSIILGQSAEGAALELGIAVSTIRTLRQRAYKKLGVHSTTQMLALVINDGLVSR